MALSKHRVEAGGIECPGGPLDDDRLAFPRLDGRVLVPVPVPLNENDRMILRSEEVDETDRGWDGCPVDAICQRFAPCRVMIPEVLDAHVVRFVVDVHQDQGAADRVDLGRPATLDVG